MNSIELLSSHDIQPSAQRVAIADYVLFTQDHPTADQVWQKVKDALPIVSRATVYNTLNLFVAKGLLRALALADDAVIFDPNIDRHHHFIDEATGQVHDIPWDRVKVSKIEGLKEYEIHDYQVVIRGKKKKRR